MTAEVLRALDRLANAGTPARLWWRDDDAVEPTAQLDRLLRVASDRDVAATLAVIPAPSGPELAGRLADEAGISVAVHGWLHRNHALQTEKKQELGAGRPTTVVLDELGKGLTRLKALHGSRIVPVLVPPWNRIAAKVVDGLPALGFQALSVFGPPRPAPIRVINTNVDIIDWKGSRGGRPTEALMAELAQALSAQSSEPIGILSHHLVHDSQAWRFLDELFALTIEHAGCQWTSLSQLLALPS